MTAKEIETILAKDRILAGHPLVCPNVNFLLQGGQQDMISLTKTGVLIQYEIKISRGDFFRDKKKGHELSFTNIEILKSNYHLGRLPNKFYYVVPANLISPEEVPTWAGLYVINGLNELMFVRKAPMIHKQKHDLLTIYKKITTLYQQRHFFGECLMTHNNRKSREAWKKLNESE